MFTLTNWKSLNNITSIKLPSQSGDISPIENLWYLFKKRLSEVGYSAKDFKTKAKRVWRGLKVEICENLNIKLYYYHLMLIYI